MMTNRLFGNARILMLAALWGMTLCVVPGALAQQVPLEVPAVNDVWVANQNLQSRESILTLGGDDAVRLLYAFRGPGDEFLGATLESLNDPLRAQLNLPAGQGILVASLRGDGPSAQAGLKAYDILLTLAGKPLATPDDLTKHLKEAGDAPVTLKLLRGGKEMSIQVRPIYRVTLGPVGEQKKEYYLGIQLVGLNEAVLSHLALPKGQGLMISEVIKKSPAEEAGIKPYDIVLEMGGKAVDTPDKLTAQIQAGKDQPTTIKLLRAGKPLSIAITAAARTVESNARLSLRLYRPLKNTLNLQEQAWLTEVNQRTGAMQLQQAKESSQTQDLRQQIEALRTAIERLEKDLKNAPPKK